MCVCMCVCVCVNPGHNCLSACMLVSLPVHPYVYLCLLACKYAAFYENEESAVTGTRQLILCIQY